MPERLAAALASWGRTVSGVLPLGGGANSRVFVMTDDAGARFCAKLHHVGEGGDSPRYRREKNFYAAVRSVGGPWMVEDMRWDDAQSVGFLEHVEGASLESPSREDVQQAGEFIRALQQIKAPGLEAASEATLQPETHVVMVDHRLKMMQMIVDADAAALIVDELRPAWERVRSLIKPSQVSPIVSPSDFGFHNALRKADGRLCFFDFEHAGMDDPAKLVCDFVVRPDSGVTPEWVDAFCEASGFGPDVKERAVGLMDLYRLKWTCIALNEFTTEGGRRREFAGADEPGRRAAQLAKARRLIREVGL
jgi:hypothetical protein